MCTVSMVGDHYRDWMPQKYPDWFPSQPAQTATVVTQPPSVPREEFDALKRDVEEMKALLLRAKKYDEDNGEPHCEMDEKVALLKQIAKVVGVDLSAVFPSPNHEGK